MLTSFGKECVQKNNFEIFRYKYLTFFCAFSFQQHAQKCTQNSLFYICKNGSVKIYSFILHTYYLTWR